jgi:hypothetical protein
LLTRRISQSDWNIQIKLNYLKLDLRNCTIFSVGCLLVAACVNRCLSFCTFSFGHCIVCSSSIYGLRLPIWYLVSDLRQVGGLLDGKSDFQFWPSKMSDFSVISLRLSKIYTRARCSKMWLDILHEPCVISEFESCSWRGVLDTRLCDKVVSDLWQVVCFLR